MREVMADLSDKPDRGSAEGKRNQRKVPKRISDPSFMGDCIVNLAYNGDSGERRDDLMGSSTPHKPVRRIRSDVTDVRSVHLSGLHPMQGALTNKQVAERLQLRRRLPRHEVPLLEVLGHKALTRLRSRPSARYIPEPDYGDDESNASSGDALNNPEAEVSRAAGAKSVPDVDETDDDYVYNLENLFESENRAWAKRADHKSVARLVTAPKEKLTGWKKFKLRQAQEWKKAQRRWREILVNLEIWRASLKTIEGNFGTSVTSYFRFLKWLLGLNVFVTLLLLGVLVFTQVFMEPKDFADSLTDVNRTRFTVKAQNCSKVYESFVEGTINNHSAFDQVLDFFSGTGFMEHTVLFYGFYFNKTFLSFDNTVQNYNMPVAYIMAATFYFLVSLVLMVKNTARGLKESQISSGEKFYHSCNKVFCSWDYTLTQDEAARYKHKNIHDDIKHDLDEQQRQRDQENRTLGQKFKLYTLRVIINLFVVAVLAGACYLIYWTSLKALDLAKGQSSSGIVALLIQFLPSIAVTVLNVIVPLLFERVVVVELYSTEFEIKLTIARMVILRLASIAVLVFTLGLQLLDCEIRQSCGSCAQNVYCWETYVGQQFYKLAVLDFFVIIGVTFLVQYPRKFIVNRYENKYKLVRVVGHQEFEIPKNVLDLVYTQTLCWLGAFYSPLIAPITVIKMFVFFYAKKVSLLHTCAPSRKTFRASNIQSFFVTILLLSFVLCIAPIVYTITNVSPSQSCGPFRIWDSDEFRMYEVVGHAVAPLPDALREILYYLGTWTFYVPLCIVLAVFIFYYRAVAAGNRKRVELLNEQLALEGKDKQFLLGLVREALLRGQLNSE